jgi:peptidoglycan hydrolase-like protein with peptidoglycan-binding domain
MRTFKKFLTAVLLASSIIAPITSAQTTSVEAQIQTLLQQVNVLQAQLTNASQPLGFTSDLSNGAKGFEVTGLQQILISQGFLRIISPTGYFGQMTRLAVMDWQRANGLPPVGRIGPLSRAILNSTQVVTQSMPAGQKFAADATNPVAGVNYFLSGSGASAAATSFTLTSLTIPQSGYLLQDSDFSTTFYVTFEPGNRSRQEIASCTTVTQNAAGTATLSGCLRGLLPFSPYNASTTYAFPHGGGTTVIFSNPPQLYNEFVAKGNAAQISGIYTFASSSLPRASTTPTYVSGDELKFATYGQLASTSFSGTVNSSLTQKGIAQIATKLELASSTALGTTGAILVPQSAYFSATSSATTTAILSKTTGKMSQGFLDLTEGFSFSGGVTSTGVFATSATTTLATTTFTGGVTGPISQLIDATTTTVTISGSTATTTLVTSTILANTLIGSNAIHGRIHFSSYNNFGAQGDTALFTLTYGGSVVARGASVCGASNCFSVPGRGYIDFTITTVTSSAQRGTLTYDFWNQASATSTTPVNNLVTDKGFFVGSASVSATSTQALTFSWKFSVSSANDSFIMDNYYVEKIVNQ